jgi:hypothetical protein
MQTLPSQNKWDDITASVYATAMKDWSDDVVQAIMVQVLNHCEYRPTVAELRKIGIEIFDPKMTPDSVYDQIRNILIMVEPNGRSVYVANKIASGQMKPEIERVVERCGGWANLGRMSSQEVKDSICKALQSVYDVVNFDHVFVSPESRKAIEDGRKMLEGI